MSILYKIYKKLNIISINKILILQFVNILYIYIFCRTIYNMSCLHRFIQIENRISQEETLNVLHQCSKCGLIDKNIPNEIHIHSATDMSFIGQSMGYYILRCKERNCYHQIRIQIIN